MSPSGAFETIKRNQFINLTTFRKSGAAVSTPVWFALENGKIYGTSQPHTGKMKRIANNPMVTIAPCTANGKLLGEAFEARARVLPDAEGKVALAALKRKYGLQFTLFTLFMRAARGYWEISEA
jgi:uncharacterized protein